MYRRGEPGYHPVYDEYQDGGCGGDGGPDSGTGKGRLPDYSLRGSDDGGSAGACKDQGEDSYPTGGGYSF